MAENAELSFIWAVLPLSEGSQDRLCPIDGVIRRITISWPSGCNFRVEVLFRVRKIQICPYPATGTAITIGGQSFTTAGVALNNFTETLNPNYPVRRNDPVTMHLINHDDTNFHMISAIVHIEGIDESAGAGAALHPPGSHYDKPLGREGM